MPTGRAQEIADKSLTAAEYEEILTAILEKQAFVPIELKPTCAPQFMKIARQRGIEQRFSPRLPGWNSILCYLAERRLTAMSVSSYQGW